jgi:hypothetical protein
VNAPRRHRALIQRPLNPVFESNNCVNFSSKTQFTPWPRKKKIKTKLEGENLCVYVPRGGEARGKIPKETKRVRSPTRFIFPKEEVRQQAFTTKSSRLENSYPAQPSWRP